MLISKSANATPWTQAVAREMTSPVFPQIPPAVRPYLLSVMLFAAASALMYAGDALLLRYGLPWTLVSLLVIVAVANLWGVRPAALVLVLSVIYGVVFVPHVPPVNSSTGPPFWNVLTLRTTLFIACGLATVWLTYRARQMHAKAERRREVVAALQSMILPDNLAEIPGYDLSCIYRPAHQEEEVGGDFYDFYPIGAGQYGLLIGDVMGNGKEAAAFTALLRYSVRAFTSTGEGPARILSQLNAMLELQRLHFETASLFLAFLDPRTGSLYYANAGHEPPLLRRADGREESLESTGPILGVGSGFMYQEKIIGLEAGDALLLMTDGVTEARNAQGKFLDCAGAWQLLRDSHGEPSAQKALASMDQALMDHIGTTACDDIAMLLLRRGSERPQSTLNIISNIASSE